MNRRLVETSRCDVPAHAPTDGMMAPLNATSTAAALRPYLGLGRVHGSNARSLTSGNSLPGPLRMASAGQWVVTNTEEMPADGQEHTTEREEYAIDTRIVAAGAGVNAADTSEHEIDPETTAVGREKVSATKVDSL